ncbi:DUF2203 family protein [Ktedonosporobacter rubrisoli]|uniref:DUF2203 family protein n=1 Tax=Ktedonosporobacter rubrisoli TaxID=2509675 RepID=A0A4P6JUU4_KTERU|nr:DUF2203 domain-containing protein [Ktedonosporobacter rubrisoli]QBD79082.1 DUF2203 family protein [Ktedonosporobacter rubrisoli]
MARYFTREEAEALLPEITVVLRKIQEGRRSVQVIEEELEELHARSKGNGHHLYGRTMKLQSDLAAYVHVLRNAADELQSFGCVLKDPDIGLIDFPSLRDGQEVYLCWQLGEERILFWHYMHTGFAGRQPL